jgi:hypothetical protein
LVEASGQRQERGELQHVIGEQRGGQLGRQLLSGGQAQPQRDVEQADRAMMAKQVTSGRS